MPLGSSRAIGTTDNQVMPACAEDVLAFVDLVLGDLTRRDGMFFGCRADEVDGETVVIQTGEDGRYHLPLPRLGKGEGAFMVTAQAHPSADSAGRCRHARARTSAATGATTRPTFLGMPKAPGSCAVGEYEEKAWHWTSLLA
jgi:hypothetical protein